MTRPEPAEPAGEDDTDPQADRWLVEKARAGDLMAYEMLVRRHRDRIYRIALRMLGNPADADDVAQDVVIQLWTALSGFAGTSSFTTWLYRVVVNRCLNHRRGQRPVGELTDADHPRAADPARRVMAGEELQAGMAAVAVLPEHLRVPFVLVQLEGLTYRETAAVTKVSEGTVRGRLARARATLMDEMRDWS